MKTVYADIVLLTNFCIDYIVLYLSFDFWKIRCRHCRFIAAAAIGAVFALAVSVAVSSGLAKLILSVVFLPFMSAVCIGKRSIKTYVRINITIYIFSFLLCGLVTVVQPAVMQLGKTSVPFFVLLFLSLLLLVVSRSADGFFSTALVTRQVTLEVFTQTDSREIRVFCDSGNRLSDPYVGLPVIIVKESKKKDLMTDGQKTRLIPMSTATGTGLGEAFTPCKVSIKTKGGVYDVKAALCFVKDEYIKVNDCDGIMPEKLLCSCDER